MRLSLKHVVSLFAVSLGIWVLLSGYMKPLMLSLGVASAVLTVFLAVRMEVIDHESHPVDISPQLLAYWFWLGVEIIKSNLIVARHVLSPHLTIKPTVARVSTGHRSDVGRTIFANSITLTPGTVTLDVGEDFIEVHGLTDELVKDLQSGAMAARVPDPGGRE